ncbi:Ankyrin repeat containing protein [Pyrenophora tritici-repentis]|nr:Ankyrin repeat containing protein [Pyrenophora tritici-repentis]
MSNHIPMTFRLMDLPLELFQQIIYEAILARGRKRGLRLMLVNRFFREQVRYVLCMNSMLDGAWPYQGEYSMVQSYLEHWVNTEPRDGNRILVIIRQVAEHLTTEESETKRYISSLCKLAMNHDGFFRSLRNASVRECILKQEFETHLHAAAVYMNHVSDIQAWGIPESTSFLFGAPYDLAARYGSTDIMEPYLQHDIAQVDICALVAAAQKGRLDMVRFIFESHMDAKSDQWKSFWMTRNGQIRIRTMLITPNPEIWDYFLNERGKVKLTFDPSMAGLCSMRQLSVCILSRCCRFGWTEMARYIIGRAKEISLPYKQIHLQIAISA